MFTPADQALTAEIEAALQDSRLEDSHRSLLHFALGKIFDDLAAYAQAIGHFDAANRLERFQEKCVAVFRPKPRQNKGAEREGCFDRAGFAAAIDRLIGAFPPGAPPATAASRSELPVLIVGMPRSGTTLVEQILASHREVAAGGERDFWSRRSGWQDGRIGGFGARAAEAAIADYLGLLAGISPNAARVTDKMPYNFLFLGLIHRLFPEARIVHCRRDPLDTALSIYFTRFARGHAFASSRADIVFYYRQYRRLMAHWRIVLPAANLLEIDYESLVTDGDAIRRLVAFCGLGWDEACLDFHRSARPVATASAWQVRQPLYRSSIGRWRHYAPWLGELRALAD
jgi:hypothetical protein